MVNNCCLYYLTVFESWFINEFMILSLFLSCSLEKDICSSRWFINLSEISLDELCWTCSLCLTHDCKNLFLKLLTSVKKDLFIFLNSAKIISLRFLISSIKRIYSVFIIFSQFSVFFRQWLAFPVSLIWQTDFELTISKACQKFL